MNTITRITQAAKNACRVQNIESLVANWNDVLYLLYDLPHDVSAELSPHVNVLFVQRALQLVPTLDVTTAVQMCNRINSREAN